MENTYSIGRTIVFRRIRMWVHLFRLPYIHPFIRFSFGSSVLIIVNIFAHLLQYINIFTKPIFECKIYYLLSGIVLSVVWGDMIIKFDDCYSKYLQRIATTKPHSNWSHIYSAKDNNSPGYYVVEVIVEWDTWIDYRITSKSLEFQVTGEFLPML